MIAELNYSPHAPSPDCRMFFVTFQLTPETTTSCLVEAAQSSDIVMKARAQAEQDRAPLLDMIDDAILRGDYHIEEVSA